MATQINLSDAFGAYERGASVGRADKENRRQEELKTLAPQIMAGDEAATTRGKVIDQKAAQGYEDEHTKQLKQLRAAANYMKDKLKGGDPMEIEAAWSSGVRPFLAKLNPGTVPPEAWDASMVPAIEKALAMTAFIDDFEGESASLREFQAKAKAAGLQPGTPEYENAAKVALGVNPRAVTGAIKFDTMTDADGKPRPQRNNPQTGGVEVFYAESNQWVPLGEGAAPPAAPQGVQAGEGDATTRVNIEGVDPAKQEKLARTAAAMAASGFEQAEIDAFMAAQLSMPQNVGAPVPAAAPTPTPVSTLGVGRTKEQEAAATKGATESMQTLSADEVAANGLPPGTFAQRNTLTGEIKVGPAAAQAEPGGMTAAQKEKLRVSANKAKTAVKGTSDELERMRKAVLQLKKNKEGLQRITGLMSMLPNIPGGAAANAQADLDALKSQIGFAVLQKMRQNSPTGGALGNVSDKEGLRLEQNLASLDNAQSYEQMVERLDQIISYVDESKNLLQTAYDEQFGEAGIGEAPASSGTVWTRDASGKLVRGD